MRLRRRLLQAKSAILALSVVVCVVAWIGLDVASAQTTGPGNTGLQERVETLQIELDALRNQAGVQRRQTRGYTTLSGASATRRAQVVTGQTSTTAAQAAGLEIRFNQLERALRDLTGKVEENQYHLNRLVEQLERMARNAEPGFPVAGATEGLPPDAGSVTSSQTFATAAPAVNAPLPERGQESTFALSGETAEEQYEYAFQFVRQQDFATAEKALLRFLELHPDHALAGSAHYWLGKTFFVDNRFDRAAEAFFAVYQNHPASSKATESLLFLGISLANLGETQDACETFLELINKHPEAPADLANRIQVDIEVEQRRAGC